MFLGTPDSRLSSRPSLVLFVLLLLSLLLLLLLFLFLLLLLLLLLFFLLPWPILALFRFWNCTSICICNCFCEIGLVVSAVAYLQLTDSEAFGFADLPQTYLVPAQISTTQNAFRRVSLLLNYCHVFAVHSEHFSPARRKKQIEFRSQKS